VSQGELAAGAGRVDLAANLMSSHWGARFGQEARLKKGGAT
jgi:hypothetical protein